MNDERPTRIYILRDPRDNAVRYVGKTVETLRARLTGHKSQARQKRGRSYRDNWMRQLAREGIDPIIELVELAGSDWAEREKYWIACYRRSGAPLTNITAGGHGTLGVKRPDFAALTSARNALIKSDPEARKRHVEAVKAGWNNDERRASLSQRNKEIWDGDGDRRAKLAALNKARANDPKKSAEMGLKIAAAWTPERRARQSAITQAMNAKRAEDPGYIATMSAQAKAAWATNPAGQAEAIKAGWTPEKRVKQAERKRLFYARKMNSREPDTTNTGVLQPPSGD